MIWIDYSQLSLSVSIIFKKMHIFLYCFVDGIPLI